MSPLPNPNPESPLQSEPLLSVELVPATAHCQNLRTALPPEYWDGIRQQCYREANYHCEICGGQGPEHPVEAHERWDYRILEFPEESRVEAWQVLVGVQALCPACHEVKHMGLAELRGRLEPALHHLAKTNNWSRDATLAYARAAFHLQHLRSQVPWGLDIEWLRSLGWKLHQYRWPATAENRIHG